MVAAVACAVPLELLYWVLWLLPTAGQVTLLDLPPWNTTRTTGWLRWPLARLTHVVGVHMFHLKGIAADWHPTGSGDTAMNYVQVVLTLAITAAGAVVWTAFDEARLHRGHGPREYHTAYVWLRLLLRFTLAVTLLSYGFAKVFPGQFGAAPRLSELRRDGKAVFHAPAAGEPLPLAADMLPMWRFIGTAWTAATTRLPR